MIFNRETDLQAVARILARMVVSPVHPTHGLNILLREVLFVESTVDRATDPVNARDEESGGAEGSDGEVVVETEDGGIGAS